MVKKTNVLNPKDYVQKLVENIINIQYDAYSTIMIKKLKAQEKANISQQELIKFDINNKVIFYHNKGYGRASKLSILWHIQ